MIISSINSELVTKACATASGCNDRPEKFICKHVFYLAYAICRPHIASLQRDALQKRRIDVNALRNDL